MWIQPLTWAQVEKILLYHYLPQLESFRSTLSWSNMCKAPRTAYPAYQSNIHGYHNSFVAASQKWWNPTTRSGLFSSQAHLLTPLVQGQRNQGASNMILAKRKPCPMVWSTSILEAATWTSAGKCSVKFPLKLEFWDTVGQCPSTLSTFSFCNTTKLQNRSEQIWLSVVGNSALWRAFGIFNTVEGRSR